MTAANDRRTAADSTDDAPASTTPAYDDLETRFQRLSAIEDALGILHWDMQTMMPPGAAEGRGEQLATLKRLAHDLLTTEEMGDLFAQAEEEIPGPLDVPDDVLNPQPIYWQRANLREMERRWRHATAVPADLVTAHARATTACEMIWREARPNSDYALILPQFRELLSLTREMAEAKSEQLGLSPYEALMDEFDPGSAENRIDALFAELSAFLPDFIQEVIDRQASHPQPRPLPGPFPIERQKKLAESMMRTLGFDFERGRLDESLHPFCGGDANDIRITNRYDETDLTSALMGALHETGHALYEQGLPRDWLGQPVGRARGMALHESQSLLIEMQVCRSRRFLAWLAPRLRDLFGLGGDAAAWEADNLYRLQTRVERGFIRVDADEVTYPAHVILRYELERALIAGDLDPADLPGAWNASMQTFLGITPPNDRLGCLQDIHWYDGAFGYFPSYTLGAMIAAQLFDAARSADSTIESALGRGDFAPLLAWLRPHVHAQGARMETEELLVVVTGHLLSPGVYMDHLRRRYLEEDGEGGA